MRDTILVKGARENNLKNVDVGTHSAIRCVFSRDFPAPESHRLPSIPSMPKAADAMLSRFLPMCASFWGRWISRMWT